MIEADRAPELGISAPTQGDDPGLEAVVRTLAGLRPSGAGFIIGVTGAVASGKSTLSRALRERLSAWPDRPVVDVVGTDGFLHSNQVLGGLGLTARKGFPESYDVAALRRALAETRLGPVDFPGYSHVIYDVDPGLARRIDRPDILIIEGLSLDLDHQGAASRLLDALIYLDAEETDIEAWFVARFLGLWAAAEHDPASFYARFRGLDRDQAAALARTVWTGVNLPNLREHICGARDLADIVVRKGPGHAIQSVTLASEPRP